MIGQVLQEMLSGVAAELRRGQGNVKWCRRCSRKHPRRRPCSLVTVAVKAKSGRMVKRQVHAERARPR